MTAAPAIEQLARGGTVITATRRLARELRRRFDAAQSAAGKRAWASADVLPYRAFLARVWHDIGDGAADSQDARPLLLNEWQTAAAWEAIIAADIAAGERAVEPLWNTHASAARAADAWRLARDWNIALADCARAGAASKHRDHQCWLRWARAFEKRCAAQNWLDPARLSGHLIRLLAAGEARLGDALPNKITFAGFDRLTPQQLDLVGALRGAGVEVDASASAPASNSAAAEKIQRRVFQNDAAQWLAAAQWAREQLRDSGNNIAIVAPNLAAAAPAIEYALRQILSPPQLIKADAEAGQLPYHISLGAPLERHPVAAAALAALEVLAGRPLPAESVSRLILSPFIVGADGESAARCKLELACRRRLPYQIRLKQLVAELAGGRGRGDALAADCPQLLAALRGALELLEDAPGRRQARPAHAWARRFNDLLGRLGWPGERALNSDEFQAANALRRELQNLATLDLAAPPMRAGDALAWLRRRAGEQAFQPEARGAPVQVLGVFEAAGQHFDALWFGGLTEPDWPPPQRPNPFLDLRLQRAAGIPEASTEANRELAETIQRRLLASADEVVLSRPVYADAEVAVEASALFGDDGGGEEIPEAAHANTPARLIAAAKPPLESLPDSRGPALTTTAAAGATAGGVAVIENQAKCPFRAFALHRLGARDLEQNAQGLDAGERGSLLHRALELAWEKIQSSAKLHALDAGELQKIIADAAEQAAKRHQVSSGCGERFHQALTRWAADTVGEWLALEKQRGAFTVAARETETALKINGLELTGKIDRIDRLETGEVALIDYKTGAPDNLRNWAGARPQAPQLPLYAIAADVVATDTVGAVAFALVKKGECAFSGVARDSQFAAGVGAVENHRSLKNDFADWNELVAHWRAALPQLADEFTAGEARVAPFAAQVCDRCHLHTLCRIQPGDGASA